MAHIHQGTVGNTGGVIFPLSGGPSLYAGSVTLTPAQAVTLQTEGFYVNFHTTANGGGEIRGQITGAKGEGMIVGVIDSGINFAHPSFAATGGDGYHFVNPKGSGTYVGVCNSSDPSFRASFTCNDKLIGARTWTGTTDATHTVGAVTYISPNDSDGHGSHTASTSAGNVITSTLVNNVALGAISGVAPHANIIAYDGCGYDNAGTWSDSCPGAALLSSANALVADGVDVVNYSISGGVDPWGDAVEQAFLNARAGGVFVSTSAGNSGPGAGTVAHVSPWLMSVAANTHNRLLQNALTNLTSNNGPLQNLFGKSLSGPLPTNTEIVYAGDLTPAFPLCGTGPTGPGSNPWPAGTFTNKIVVCDRGTYGRVEKAENVFAAGASGFVLLNDAANAGSLIGDPYPLPGVHLSFADGVILKAWLHNGAASHTGRIQGTVKDLSPSNGDIMASFSLARPRADCGSQRPEAGRERARR